MNFFKLVIISALCLPAVSYAATNDFAVAASLLNAAKAGNIQQVQMLISTGADVNYKDSTGLSLVCTAIMNNDTRASQILQMYGADASNCDRQIKDYKFRNVPETSSGFFGGLSKPQGLTLIGAGVAAAVGGLFLLTDVFDADNGNSGGGGGNNNNNNNNDNNGGSTTNNGTPLFANGLPYGPATVNAAGEAANYADNLVNWYAQTITGGTGTVDNLPYYGNFLLMNANVNYLLLMRGYSPFARGYFGMRTLRNLETRVPFSSEVLKEFKLGVDPVMGGRPVNVALVTANGINAADGTSLQNRFLIWTDTSGTSSLNGTSNSMISSKYYNNAISLGENNSSVEEDTVAEDSNLLANFDRSNSGTVINNVLASDLDNLLVKVVGGLDSGYAGPDFVGFMPNGQMTIYRTGGGHVLTNEITPVDVGDYSFAGLTLATDDTFSNFLNDDWTVTLDGTAVTLTSSTDDTKTVKGYLISNVLYLDTNGNGIADSAYTFSDNNIVQEKGLGDAQTDYYNYRAMFNAADLNADLNGNATNATNQSYIGRSKVDIIANLDVIEPLHLRETATISDILSAGTENYWTRFKTLVTDNYGANSIENDSNLSNFFTNINQTNPRLLVFSTGASVQESGANYQDALQEAAFENAAPLVFNNLEHLFMSVVAVGAPTTGVTSISPNSGSMPVSGTKYQLATWHTGTGDDTTYYRARTCGVAGRGNSDLDPWCFAAVGLTDELATAAATGAAGVLKSAFYYMTPQQIFTLLALTADGPFLKTLADGTNLTEEDLIARLSSMYDMPPQYQYEINYNGKSYLDAFKEVYGYGVINLERATKPGTNLYYYTGGKIVSTPNNSYWRAATNTMLRGSSALNIGRNAINIAAYDVLESMDGSMSLPRIWENTLEFGNSNRHELYMGDVLSDLNTRNVATTSETIRDFTFSLARSDRAYTDNMNGLDIMRAQYNVGNWTLGADWQHYLTDGKTRFFDSGNPILGLMSNAATSDVTYNYGNWAFGARTYSGAITDEGLLENDPVVSSNYEPLRLGTMFGAQSVLGWHGKKFGFNTSFGMARESNTVLGAYGDGMIAMGAADTSYVDSDVYWMPTDDLYFDMRATFAHTMPTAGADTIMRLTDLDSNSFALDARIGRFGFGVSLPLAVTRGALEYDYADYEIVDESNGKYGLAISDSGVKAIDVTPSHREVRLNATYKHKFGEFTDGAFGLIYRINPNNTDEFGNESIFMMKMSHRLGI